jgi:hypothetical protein
VIDHFSYVGQFRCEWRVGLLERTLAYLIA